MDYVGPKSRKTYKGMPTGFGNLGVKEKGLHTSNVVVLIAGDVKPGAGTNKIRIPALKYFIGIV